MIDAIQLEVGFNERRPTGRKPEDLSPIVTPPPPCVGCPYEAKCKHQEIACRAFTLYAWCRKPGRNEDLATFQVPDRRYYLLLFPWEATVRDLPLLNYMDRRQRGPDLNAAVRRLRAQAAAHV